jgi:uncharacterized membrane protein (TIGR02234 family)
MARRSLTVWLAAVVSGAGLILLASGRTWATVAVDKGAGAFGSGRMALSGGQLSPLLGPTALAALAAGVAVLATRGLARRAIGVVIALCGLGVAGAAWTGTRPATIAVAAAEHATTATGSASASAAASVTWLWPAVAAVGGLILLAGGALAVVRGGRWPGMSGRYDRPSAGRTASKRAPGTQGTQSGPATGDRALWDAIDKGADPTLDPADPANSPGPAEPGGRGG